jgi:VWFA-related protein
MTATRGFGITLLAAACSLAVEAQQPIVTFRAGTDVVLVPVWVKDGEKTIAGLTAADFVLTDNGVPQDIVSVMAESQPIDVTLALDVSGSLRGASFDALRAGVQEIGRSLPSTDRMRLLTFATNVVDVFGLQPGGREFPIDRISPGGATTLYDALGAAFMSVPVNDRLQLVFLVSDGVDTLSFLDASQVVSLADASGACLYVTVVRPKRANEPGAGIRQAASGVPVQVMWVIERLREAAARSGGLLYEHPPDVALAALFEQVTKDFRTSYLLSYTPRGVARDGWHDLTVRTKQTRYTVRARRGYQG